MIVYTNGCSHTAGGCYDNHKNRKSWPHIIMKSLVSQFEFNPTIDKSIDSALFNDALHGAGNDNIFHTTLERVTKLIGSDLKPDYVFIQWSGPNRRLYCTPQGKKLFVNLYDNVEHGVKFEPMGTEHTIHYMFCLQEFLKKHNIEYYFFNYMEIDKSAKNLSIYNKLDMDKFIDFNIGRPVIESSLLKYIKENDMACDPAGHPNDDGNYFIAKKIAKIIDIDLISKDEFFKKTIV